MEVVKNSPKKNTESFETVENTPNAIAEAMREARASGASSAALASLKNGKIGARAAYLYVKGSIRIQVINTYDAGTDAKRVAICPGDHPTVASLAAYNYSADAILTDGYAVGNLADGINVISTKNGITVEQFMRFIKRNAFLLEEVMIESDKAATFSQIIDYGNNLPFDKHDERDIDMNEYISAFQVNDKKATMMLAAEGKETMLNAESVLVWPFPADSETFLTLKGTFYVPLYG